jgi:GSCFA family protein
MRTKKSLHPYSDLPQTAFWKTAVAAANPLQIAGLWQPKYPITPKHKVVTAGSCFAQHFGRALAGRNYNWLDAEPAPVLLNRAQAREFSYGIFSFRTGNIYTARMLRQWLSYAFGEVEQDTEVWRHAGRYYDPLRPAIEPQGFVSEAELFASRTATYAAIRRAVSRADLFVFTMGLTECWRNRETGLEYAMCPGTLAGHYDEGSHKFVSQRYPAIQRDMRGCLDILRKHNPRIRVLLTVSPVPLTATASGQHVLTATSYSKSVLRAVAGDLAEDLRYVDYFPSYEIITHPAYRGMFYAANQRSVVQQGVDHVMDSFFADQQTAFPEKARRARRGVPEAGQSFASANSQGAVKCEEEILDAFAR